MNRRHVECTPKVRHGKGWRLGVGRRGRRRAIFGGLEIAAPLTKSRVRASAALGVGGALETRALVAAPAAGPRAGPAGGEGVPGSPIAGSPSGCRIASNSLGLRYASAECSRWRL